MNVAVGSMNPGKIEAVTRAFAHYYPDASVQGVDVTSGVHHTPRDEDLIRGALNRARDARVKTNADFGVGLEGGLLTRKEDGKTYLTGYVAVTNGKETHGSFAMMWEVPQRLIDKADAGVELADAVDELSGTTDAKHKAGAAGFFSKGALSRKDAFYQAVIGALIPFVSKELY